MTSMGEPDATDLFAPWEGWIDSWETFQQEVNRLTSTYSNERFVWRGHANARWGLRSSLDRALTTQLDRPPTEDDLVAAEKRLLHLARIEWRLDGIPALQLFAQMQHVGVPTRLLDVTFNPLIAAWFAVARDPINDEDPARLLVFTDSNRPLQLNTNWNSNTPRWHRLTDETSRRRVNWGTGLGRKIWRPPALHDRIPAQNAAFILDGAPIDALESGRTRPDGRSIWAAAELRRFASVPMRLAHVGEDRLPKKAPVFTYRISPGAKSEIREQLEERFGYRFATVYADIEGMAEYVKRWPEQLI
ncbi:FRG domain-containing protein [Microbacterium sp. HA-8]|uniref:FRG domain-containing protein n=1 Tax=Microbacterium sp. HA-8 TaxID=3234200 RepID=UPI0038F6A869